MLRDSALNETMSSSHFINRLKTGYSKRLPRLVLPQPTNAATNVARNFEQLHVATNVAQCIPGLDTYKEALDINLHTPTKPGKTITEKMIIIQLPTQCLTLLICAVVKFVLIKA